MVLIRLGVLQVGIKDKREKGEYYFNKYIDEEDLDGGYYFFIHKSNPRRKYALLQQVDKKDKKHPLKIHSVWSALNSPLTLDRLPVFPLVKEIPELKDVYKDVDIENSDHIKDRDRKSLEHDILISCKLPEESFKDAVRNLKEILEGDAYKDYKFNLNNIKDKNEETPLYHACRNNNIEVVKLLIEHGADVNTKDKYDKTPLNLACYNNNKELAKLLIEHGADVNLKGNYGTTSLHQACFKGNTEIAKLLIEHGADINSKDEDGWTPLYRACDKDNIEVVKLLLEHGADVNIKDKNDSTPLIWACYKDITELAKFLIEHGADVNVKDEYGYTPLSWTCVKKNTEVTKLLLDHGANPNSKDINGDTPLFWAFNDGDIEVAKLLIEHGAWKGLDVNKLPRYITNNKEIEELVLSYLNKNKGRNESVRLRRLYRL